MTKIFCRAIWTSIALRFRATGMAAPRSDETSYWKLRDGVYVVTWREMLIDLAAVFVYDMEACRSAGCACGTPGSLAEPRHILTGALFEKRHDAGYPADIELV